MSVVETYANTEYLGHPCDRWWAHPQILVGGSICGMADGQHLVDAYGVRAFLSVETEHTDAGKVPGFLPAVRLPVPDDGSPPPPEHWVKLVAWARTHNEFEKKIFYVHCQMGGSRSPAAAYAIMRWAFGMTPDAALASIRATKTDYGTKPYHQSYLGAAEDAFHHMSAEDIANLGASK